MTYLYRIRCDTFGPALARKNTKPWRSTPIHVSLTFDRQTIWALYPTPYRSGNVGLTHFLMKHLGEVGMKHLERSGKEKKDPLRGSFFSYRPSASAAPRSVRTQQRCLFAQKSCSAAPRPPVSACRPSTTYTRFGQIDVDVAPTKHCNR